MEEPTSARELFKGRHFDHEIIVLCVRWYLTFKLSSRDLVQMMAERGIVLAHTTILRWVQRYVPDFEKRWNHYARPVGDSWRVDETYIKVHGLGEAYEKTSRRPFPGTSSTAGAAASKTSRPGARVSDARCVERAQRLGQTVVAPPAAGSHR